MADSSSSGTIFMDDGSNDTTGHPWSDQVTRVAPRIRFRTKARQLFAAGPRDVARERQAIVAILTSSADSLLFNEFLRSATASSNPSRLDIAIDVLSELGDITLEYARDFLIQDVCFRGFNGGGAWKPNAGFWYILLRAAARCDADLTRREDFVAQFVDPNNESSSQIMDAVIEALGDLADEGSSKAEQSLRYIARTEKSGPLKELAESVLEDL